MATRKKCKACGKAKRSASFFKSKKNDDGLSQWCKPCLATYDSKALGGREIMKLVRQLSNLNSSDHGNVIVQECEKTHREYGKNKYTNYAVRLGRSVEAIIYALSDEWGINQKKEVVPAIEKCNKELQTLNNKILASKKSTPINCEETRDQILKELRELGHELKYSNQIKTRTVNGPPTLGHLITLARKKFGLSEKTERKLSKKMKLLLSFRNAAAHADLNRIGREISRDEAAEMKVCWEKFLHELVQFSDQIQRSRASKRS